MTPPLTSFPLFQTTCLTRSRTTSTGSVGESLFRSLRASARSSRSRYQYRSCRSQGNRLLVPFARQRWQCVPSPPSFSPRRSLTRSPPRFFRDRSRPCQDPQGRQAGRPACARGAHHVRYALLSPLVFDHALTRRLFRSPGGGGGGGYRGGGGRGGGRGGGGGYGGGRGTLAFCRCCCPGWLANALRALQAAEEDPAGERARTGLIPSGWLAVPSLLSLYKPYRPRALLLDVNQTSDLIIAR